MNLNVTGDSTKTYDQLIQIFKALAHPARLEILEVLRNGEQCVCHMEAMLGYRQAYLSQQLSVLRESGIIQDQREGWNIYYRVIKPDIYAMIDLAKSMVGFQTKPIKTTSQNECLCPKCSNKREGKLIEVDLSKIST